MVIGERLKTLRQQKKMTQVDVETRTGLLRCYISRVEQGHTVPSIPTLEKMAQALEVPLYQLFFDGKKPAAGSKLPKLREWGTSRQDAKTLLKFRKLFKRLRAEDVNLLLFAAQKMYQERERTGGKSKKSK
jgi:transcriptional regulator with XRE-family HTH domain